MLTCKKYKPTGKHIVFLLIFRKLKYIGILYKRKCQLTPTQTTQM